MNYAGKTKAELIELIEERNDRISNLNDEILDLKNDLKELKTCKKYENTADEIKDMFDKLVERNFTIFDAADIVKTMISAGQIPAKRTYNRYLASLKKS